MPDPLGEARTSQQLDTGQVRRLVGQQFLRWAGLPVQPVANGGWDNWTFHLGADMVVRLPSASEYALAVGKEHRWLPVLAPRLPLPIPAPLAKGQKTLVTCAHTLGDEVENAAGARRVLGVIFSEYTVDPRSDAQPANG